MHNNTIYLSNFLSEALDFDGNAEDKAALINILIPDCIYGS